VRVQRGRPVYSGFQQEKRVNFFAYSCEEGKDPFGAGKSRLGGRGVLSLQIDNLTGFLTWGRKPWR